MTTKTCFNCAHQRGVVRDYMTCDRAGTFCDLEMKYGGRCAGPEKGVPQMNLWEPRRTIWMRLLGLNTKVKP